MRRLAGLTLLALAALVPAACGGGGKSSNPPTTAAEPSDPGLAAMARLRRAVQAHDDRALWNLLSASTRRRLGPTYTTFRRREARNLERRFGSLLAHPLRGTVVSERITGPFGVVAVRSGGRVLAVPLHHDGGHWKLYLGGPLSIRVLGPDVGSVGRVAQVAYEIRGAPEGAVAVLYVDGVTQMSKEAVARGTATVYSNLVSPLTPGLHNAVAFATAGGAAAAKAWTFTAR